MSGEAVKEWTLEPSCNITQSTYLLCLSFLTCVIGMIMVPLHKVVLMIRQEQCLAHSRAVCVSYCYYYNFWWVEVLYKPDSKSRRDLIYWN